MFSQRRSSHTREHENAFMNCIIKVNLEKSGWVKTVLGVLKSTEGVHSFKMDGDGLVKVSGYVDPELLLKKLGKEGKRAKVCWIQYGQCSSNLFEPNTRGGGHGMLPYHQSTSSYAPIAYEQGHRYLTAATSSYAPIGYDQHMP